MFIETTATRKIKRTTKRVRLIAGGSSASKTISILLYLIAKAQSDKKPTLTSVVSESFPHLRRGAMRDFLNIMQEHRYYKDELWSKTDFTYTFETGSKIEFFSADQPGKVRGPRRDRLFGNEINNIPQEAWEQLLIRTREFAFADWNPTNDFYMYEEYGINEDDQTTSVGDSEFMILTYKDNEALEQSIVEEIERRKTNKMWWQVYGEGKRGEVEGKIYKDWQIIDEIPFNARLEGYGLDFGYSNDPSALVAVYYYDGGYILDEITYQKGLSNKQLADIISNQKRALVVADSAEPKSIDEIASYGIMITAANKGQGSVLQGIQYVQDQRISMTKRSLNVIKEYRNYLWKTDRDGKIINEPDHTWSHAMDAVRYRLEALRPQTNLHAYKPKTMLSRKYGR